MSNDALATLLFAGGILLLGFMVLLWQQPDIDAAVKKAEDELKEKYG